LDPANTSFFQSLFFFTLSNNHLRNALPSKRLTIHKCLSPNTSQKIAQRGSQQHDRRSNQASDSRNDGQPLNKAHDAVDGRTHVIGLETADEAIEGGAGRADAQEEGDLDEENDEGADAATYLLVDGLGEGGLRVDEQADHAEEDHPVELEDIGDPEREAEDDAEDADPV
jgi:hypothetical protein